MRKITEKSDVYSFGIVMLEVLTGKQPIDPTIPDGLHIVDWVRRRRMQGGDVLDPRLGQKPEIEIQEMMQTLGVAMLCVHPTPEDRPTMRDVAAMVREIRQEREEVVVKGLKMQEKERSINGETSSPLQGLCLKSGNNSSFSASLLLRSSSSTGKFDCNEE